MSLEFETRIEEILCCNNKCIDLEGKDILTVKKKKKANSCISNIIL